jgi:hypothetical protein
MANYNPLEFTNPTDLTHIWDNESIDDEEPLEVFQIDHLFTSIPPSHPPGDLLTACSPVVASSPIEFNFPNPVPKCEQQLPAYVYYDGTPPLIPGEDEDPLGEALEDEVIEITDELIPEPAVPVKEEYYFPRQSFPPPLVPTSLPFDFPPPIPPPPPLKRTREPETVPQILEPTTDLVDIDIGDFKLPASKTPIMEAMVVCALNGWGIEIVKSNRKSSTSAEVVFLVSDFNRYYKISRAICSKHRPTDDLGSRIKSLRRWFVNFPKKKDRVENSFYLTVKPSIAIKVYDIIEKNSISMSLVKRRRQQ